MAYETALFPVIFSDLQGHSSFEMYGPSVIADLHCIQYRSMSAIEVHGPYAWTETWQRHTLHYK